MLKTICYDKYYARVQDNPMQFQNLRFVNYTRPIPLPNLPTSKLDLTEHRFPYQRFKGIMAANFTPINKDGSVNYNQKFYNEYA